MNIAMLVSGGVDSAVALRLLVDQGYQVSSFYLKIWLEDELAYLGHCPWQEDLEFLYKICDQVKVPLTIISLQKEYLSSVVSYALAEVKRGRTPNPDIMCNTHIKYGLFFNSIDNSFDKVATGHYAQTVTENNRVQLKCAPDLIKDQTYFLANLSQNQLQRALYPIGQYTKQEVRALARQMNLPNKDRRDSQGICFLGKIKFRNFIKHHLGIQQGPLVEIETGNQVGVHEGFWFYTVGQRQGLGLAGGPWYVVAKNTLSNTVYISRSYYEQDKKRNSFLVGSVHWIAGDCPDNTTLLVKIRHGHKKYSCTLVQQDKNIFLVTLDENDQGIAAGQFAVFYWNDICLGCGVIQ